jgi:hypothetical protein
MKAIIFDGIWHILRVLPWPVDVLLFFGACFFFVGTSRRRGY